MGVQNWAKVDYIICALSRLGLGMSKAKNGQKRKEKIGFDIRVISLVVFLFLAKL